MTIAAGIIHSEGILLCSDTQIESGAMKTHSPKMGYFDCPEGRIAFAMAGASAFALSAIQRVKRALASVEPSQVLGEVEFILGDEYDKVVFHHPSYSTAAHTISYFFLLAIYSQTGKSRLFSTYENTMHEVTGHACIGVGQELAQYILGPAVSQGRTEREATLTAAYMLNKVKEHVPGCGGMSQFVAMRPDGAVEILDPFPYSEFARYASMIHDGAARRLLLSCADDGDAQFQEQLDVFSGVSRSIRDYWKQINREDPLVRQIRNMRKE